jgi:hypothetical protein
MYIAKSGDYALLPEPFYFNQSIVKYNNRVYECIVSNNDPEFIIGKWELLSSSDRRLNALDRIVGYYQPTINMPGLDLTQLVSGITYPNSTYLGNAFAPADEFPIDTILTDRPFYPTGVNSRAVVWDGTKYVIVANTADYSTVLYSPTADNWVFDKIAIDNISTTDIAFNDSKYIATSNNNATPIYESTDGILWSVLGQNNTGTSVEATSLNSVSYLNGVWVAVGDNIVRSSDALNWTQKYQFTNGLVNQFNGVSGINVAPYFTGFVAVGLGQRVVGTDIVPVNLISTSTNGTTWTDIAPLSTKGFNSVAASSSTIVAVGDDGGDDDDGYRRSCTRRRWAGGGKCW